MAWEAKIGKNDAGIQTQPVMNPSLSGENVEVVTIKMSLEGPHISSALHQKGRLPINLVLLVIVNYQSKDSKDSPTAKCRFTEYKI